jgi:hypothetical protein
LALLRLEMIMMETCEQQTKLHQSSIPVAQFSEAAHENCVANLAFVWKGNLLTLKRIANHDLHIWM